LNNDIKAWTNYSWQLRLTHVYDTSAERKTAENLLGLMLKEKAYIESELGQRLIGWVSDASGESHCRWEIEITREEIYSTHTTKKAGYVVERDWPRYI